ncbi:MAG: AAA family ATPase [Desulfobacteraceae bacterium]|nr:AAA family ATPase [Desulfobacteraceae bacterium]
MLKNLTICGFKSVLRMDSGIQPGQVNVLIGANGSGKSAFLEAVGVLSAAVAGRVDEESLRFRGVRLGTPGLYKSSFHGLERLPASIDLGFMWANTKGAWEYSVSLMNRSGKPEPVWKFCSEELSLNNKSLIRRSESAAKLSVFKSGGQKNSDEKIEIDRHKGSLAFARGIGPFQEAEDMFGALEEYALYSPRTPVLRGVETDSIQKDPLGLCGGRLADAVETLTDYEDEMFGDLDLDDLLDILGWVDQMKVGRPTAGMLSPSVPRPSKVLRLTDRFMHAGHNELTAYDASEGVLYTLFVLALAMHPKAPRFFAIDNFDQAMHPRLARKTADFFCQAVLKNSRRPIVFFTTHNPLVLDGLDLSDERICLFAVDRNSEGHTKIRKVLLSPDLLAEGAKGIPLSRLWVMGRLGGLNI